MKSDSQRRRRAHAQGLNLIKPRERSRSYVQYGPYALADAETNCLVAYGMDAEDVDRQLGSG